MWIMTKSDWPVLVNLARSAHIGYQQLTKFDPRTRLIAGMWEQEFTIAECATGDEARALMSVIAQHLAAGTTVLDLREIDVTGTTEGP
ncbi:MAG: hypothetical protein KC442_17060 [Thermomicrobiales bacterium]|nr:hypothetical protein [Thermomicrobiales bacterium]